MEPARNINLTERGWHRRDNPIKTAIHDHGNIMAEIQFAVRRGDIETVDQCVQLAHDVLKRILNVR